MARVYGACAEYLAAKYGGVFETRALVVTVATTGTQIANPDPERILLIFVNLEPAGNMNVLPDNASLPAGAMVIAPAGGKMEWNVDDHGIMPAIGWRASHGAGGNMLVITTRREFITKPGGTPA